MIWAILTVIIFVVLIVLIMGLPRRERGKRMESDNRNQRIGEEKKA